MNGSTLIKAFVNLPGGATAVYNSSGLAYYRHSDHLGSSRLASTPARGLYSSTAYAPFGEPYATAGTADASFTGQNQDTVPSLYDFTFRKHSHSQGRWISPDPLGVGAVDPTNPQTWNRYAYVANNPLSHIDPLGLDEDACNPDTEDCGGGGGSNPGPDPGPDPGIPAPPPGPPSIPGFCDASCGGSGFGGGVDANGIPNNFGPGYLMQATSPMAQLGAAESRYLSIITTGYDPAFGDPCAYLNNAGNSVESTDYDSNPGECTDHGGIWVPQNYTLGIDPSGSAYILPPNCQQVGLAAAAASLNGMASLPPANQMVGGGILSIAAGLLKGPVAGALTAAAVFRNQLGDLVLSIANYNISQWGCMLSQGIPVPHGP